MNVALCVCTYKRPQGLQTLLDSLKQLNGSHELHIFVADNDPEGTGIAVCEALPADYPYPVATVLVPENGISFARNAAIGKALESSPNYLAFLDDDEWPDPNWLNELLRIQQSTDADAVGGPTISVFPDNVAPELRDNPYFGASLPLADGAACQLEAAGNFLIRAGSLTDLGPNYFHPDFAQSGGEDLAFFTILSQRGARMHWASNACVSESVPENRLTQAWLRSRVINISNSRVRVMQMLQPGMKSALIRALKTCALAGVALLATVLGVLNKGLAARARLLRWKFIGKFTAHIGQKMVRGEGH